jgi:hypothetical protein
MGMRTVAGWTGIEWFLDGFGDKGFVLSHAVPEADQAMLCDPTRGDHILVATLLWAMRNGKDIMVEGTVSPRLLDGLETLQAIWQRWQPDRYAIVEIRVTKESEPGPLALNRPGLFAFSGGVDGSFSFFRHLQGKAGRSNRKPGAALFVHGMDIPLEREDFFVNAAERVERMLNRTGVPLLRVQTNTRKLGMDFDDSFGLQLASCFFLFQNHFAWAMKGSEEPYDELVLPWGSTPLTDPLCATAAMQLVHDGCIFDRTQKVRWLAQNTEVSGELRVCWAGENLDRNCGDCEKCVRTMLNFWAAGEVVPNAFPTQLTPERVRRIRPKNEPQLHELISLMRYAVLNHAHNDQILRAVMYIIRRYKILKLKKKSTSYFRRIFARG